MELLDKVYRFISLRPRSEKEIRDYLHGKHASNQDFEKIIQLLIKQKLLDDKAFVVWWLDQRATFRPKGKRALKTELKQKGISDELIEETLNEGVDELSQAQKVIQKKLKIYGRLPYLERKAKLSAFLARNGFSWEIIRQVVNTTNDDLPFASRVHNRAKKGKTITQIMEEERQAYSHTVTEKYRSKRRE